MVFTEAGEAEALGGLVVLEGAFEAVEEERLTLELVYPLPVTRCLPVCLTASSLRVSVVQVP